MSTRRRDSLIEQIDIDKRKEFNDAVKFVVRSRMEELKLNRKTVGPLIDVTYNTFCELLNKNKRDLSLNHIIKLERVLQCDILNNKFVLFTLSNFNNNDIRNQENK